MNMSKFCFYHRAYGHETNSCWNLQDVIESMVKAVQLDFDRLARTASFLREEVKGLSDSRKSSFVSRQEK